VSNLPTRVRQARRRAGLSQTGLAAATGVNRSAVAQWERREGCTPRNENLAKIAVATKTQYEWLATGRGRMTLDTDGLGAEDGALMFRVSAHDEVEERTLTAMRKLEYWQAEAVAELVEGLSRGRFKRYGKEKEREPRGIPASSRGKA
jgi:transcriptional regulator with XRE-family HTH domain